MNQPRVTAIITTCGRPQMLRDAVASILSQDYAGPIELITVFDGTPIDALTDVTVPPGRTLRTLGNSRSAGLSGGRNTGILAASGSVVAFCDDDDIWLPQKLRLQLHEWERHPDAVALATGIRIQTGSGAVDRDVPRRTGLEDLLRSRVTAIHPSSLLYRREDLTGRIGLVDEALPASYGEDYDLLLRAARHGYVLAVTEPLVVVRWNRPSFFAGKWGNIASGLTYLLEKFPEFATTPKGTARIAGQVAFALAALGSGRRARKWAASALRRDPFQLRAYAAIAVSLGLVPPAVLLRLVERRGHGL